VTFPVDDILLGPASFGPRKGTEGIIWHTTEGTDASRASAVSTANWQKSNPGSYGWIIYDGGLLLTVPYLEASGGVNPASLSWAPFRFPFLRALLSSAAYADPNAYLVNVAFSGKTAVFRDVGMPQNMIDTAVQLTRWIEAQPWSRTPLVHSGHMHWQQNRSDPSQVVLDRIAAAYAPPQVDDMPSLTNYALERITIGVNANIRSAPTLAGAPVFQTTAESEATRVGTITNGEDAEWSVYYHPGRKQWLYTAKQNVVKVEPLPVQTVEIIKEVPGDCSVQDAKLAKAADAVVALRGANKAESVAIEALATVVNG
jgi:hypothetical protein